MTAELNSRGHACPENTVAELMRKHGIRAKAPRRFARTTDPNHRPPVAANDLDRNFDPEGPNESWRADITYIPTHEGWLYLVVVEDPFSRMVVGWSMAETMESRLVVDALGVVLARRRPGAGLLAHSDRGSQCASEHDQRALAEEGITCSRSGVGQCWDNAPMESLFGRLKCEVAPGEVFATRDQARAEIFEYLGVFYNRVRRHSSLGFLSPAEFERTYRQNRR
jgi:transposase InsO family protein